MTGYAILVYLYMCVFIHLWLSICLSIRFQTLRNPTLYRNVLFNDALNTFYIRLYGVKNQSERERERERERETRCRHYIDYSFRLGIFNMYHPTDKDITYYDLCYTRMGNSPMIHHEGLIQRPIAP